MGTNKIYFPSKGVEDWRQLLAKPELQWEPGYSAMTLARCWEAADGLPPEIERALSSLDGKPELLLALPEHKVPLPGSHLGASQNDILALVRVGERTAAVAIEGKVDEPFDQPLGEWLQNASAGKRTRLSYICDLLGLAEPVPESIYYQLVHRAASAVIEARRFKTDLACMIVHSFSSTQPQMWFDAFAAFAGLFGATAEPGRLLAARPNGSPPLYLAWVEGDQQFRAAHEKTGVGDR